MPGTSFGPPGATRKKAQKWSSGGGGNGTQRFLLVFTDSSGLMSRKVSFDEKLPLIGSARGEAEAAKDEGDETIHLFCGSFKRRVWNEIVVILLMALVIALGSMNSIASQIMTVPMGNYSFFLSVFNPILYALQKFCARLSASSYSSSA